MKFDEIYPSGNKFYVAEDGYGTLSITFYKIHSLIFRILSNLSTFMFLYINEISITLRIYNGEENSR